MVAWCIGGLLCTGLLLAHSLINQHIFHSMYHWTPVTKREKRHPVHPSGRCTEPRKVTAIAYGKLMLRWWMKKKKAWSKVRLRTFSDSRSIVDALCQTDINVKIWCSRVKHRPWLFNNGWCQPADKSLFSRGWRCPHFEQLGLEC